MLDSTHQLKPRKFFGRSISRQQLSDIRRTVELMSNLSRQELAHTICEHLDWHASSGEDSTYAALAMLEILEKEGFLSLPAKDESKMRGVRKAPERTAAGEPGPVIDGDLSALGNMVLEPVDGELEVALFKEWIDRYHALGYRQQVGCYMRYFVVDGQGRRLGCLLFQRASKSLQSREQWIGWNDRWREQRLERVVCNSRFLILPWVRVHNLASHVLSLVVFRLAEDWQARWKVRPVLVEAFVDGVMHSGTIYRAAGWEKIGQSAGHRKSGTGRKDLYVKALQKDACAILRGERRTRKRKHAALEVATPADGPLVSLWLDLVGIITETAAMQDPAWRVRRRTIGTLLVMLFVFRLVFSNNHESHAITIHELWDQCRLLDVELPQPHPVAASAMSTARQKVDERVFQKVHRRLLQRMGDEAIPRWCGRRLYAVDGSKMNVPRQLLNWGYQTPQPEAWYPQGLVSCLYRLNDRMPIDFDLASHGNERIMAAQHLQQVRAGDVVVYDRGYYSFELLHDHVRRGVDCVFRLPGSSAKEFERFAASGESQRIVEVTPGKQAKRRWNQLHPREILHPITVRCVRIPTTKEDFLIATTLTDDESFPSPVLGEAYQGRWGIEELYKVSKRLIKVEQFHAQTERGVRQELFAHFTVVALTRSLGNQVQEVIGGCVADEAQIQVNFKHALATVARRFEALILGHAQMVAETVSCLLKSFSECIAKARPGRSYARKSKRPDDRFRSSKGKSAKPTVANQTKTA